MASSLIGAVLGAILWPWWAVPALITPLYAMQAIKTCGWRIEAGLGCDAAGLALGGGLHLAAGFVAWWVAGRIRRRWAAAGSR